MEAAGSPARASRLISLSFGYPRSSPSRASEQHRRTAHRNISFRMQADFKTSRKRQRYQRKHDRQVINTHSVVIPLGIPPSVLMHVPWGLGDRLALSVSHTRSPLSPPDAADPHLFPLPWLAVSQTSNSSLLHNSSGKWFSQDVH